MNAMLTPVRSLDQDRHLDVVDLDDATRLSLFDRLSLRVGLHLMLRAERLVARSRDHDTHAISLANAREIGARERFTSRESLVQMFR
jgi:hypothetical protein